jgi:hypothetical protein
VAVLVELKARFDEARNVSFANKLEDAGCNVAYGLVGLKTHCKTTLVIRQEGELGNALNHAKYQCCRCFQIGPLPVSCLLPQEVYKPRSGRFLSGWPLSVSRHVEPRPRGC